MARDPGQTAPDLLDALPDGVVVADENGVVTVLNAAAAELLGIGSDAVGKPLADVLALADRKGNGWFACADPYTGLANRTQLAERAWFLADGTELLLTARILRDGPRAPVRQVAVSLRSARARARLDRERSDLVATVAHELRSPLTGVKGFVATLLSKWDRLNDEQKKMMLETVNADADRLTRLIAELLDVARIDTGRLSLFPRPLDFDVAVRRVVDSVHAGTGRDIAFDVAGELPRVSADPDKLAQVLTNLVDNALAATAGRGRVTLGLAQTADAVTVDVVDDGPGIPAADAGRVFERLVRLDPSRSSGGSGLGLAIARGIAEAHGGTLVLVPSEARGARFRLTLPVRAPLPTSGQSGTPSGAGARTR